MILARQICKTTLHLAVVGLAVCGVWAPYSHNALYLVAALRALIGVACLVDTTPNPKHSTPMPLVLGWLFWYGPIFPLALVGWWWLALAFSVGALGVEVRVERLKKGGSK